MYRGTTIALIGSLACVLLTGCVSRLVDRLDESTMYRRALITFNDEAASDAQKERAIELAADAAHAGFSPALELLARMHRDGYGRLDSDEAMTERLLLRAYEQHGSNRAAYRLSRLYRDEDSPLHDTRLAREFLGAAAMDLTDPLPEAQCDLAFRTVDAAVHESEYERARKLARAGIEAGEDNQYLGTCHLVYGYAEDFRGHEREAFTHYELATGLGQERGYALQAKALYSGVGVPRDRARARRLSEIGALEHGDAAAWVVRALIADESAREEEERINAAGWLYAARDVVAREGESWLEQSQNIDTRLEQIGEKLSGAELAEARQRGRSLLSMAPGGGGDVLDP